MAGTPATFGKMYTMGVLNAAKNVAGANYAAALLSQKEFSSSLAKEMGVASARRDVLAVQTADPYQDVFNRAALIANGWLDPDVAGSTNAFRLAVEDVLSGRRSPNDAINVLEGRLVYRITDPDRPGSEAVLTPQSGPGVVEPTILHEVEPLGSVRFFVEFLRAPETRR